MAPALKVLQCHVLGATAASGVTAQALVREYRNLACWLDLLNSNSAHKLMRENALHSLILHIGALLM